MSDDLTLVQTELEAAPDAPPELPGYRLEALLGAGAFGAVWAGVQERTGLRVAVKLLHRGSSFRGELERLRELAEHPYILTLLDADLDHRPAFLVTPLLSGGSLARAQGSLERRVQWIQQLAEALEFTHRKGLLHCDVKPANVLLDEEGRARLADFGQSVSLEASRGSLGTLGYMAPEQVSGAPSPGWDIYGLGATAWFLLTGKVPRWERQALPDLRLYPTLLGELEPLPSEVDDELAAIVRRCLCLDPAERYQDGAEVLADLQRRETRALREALATAQREARRATSQLLVAEARGAEPSLALLLAAASLELGGAAGQAETLIRERAEDLDETLPGQACAPVSQVAWAQGCWVATALSGEVRRWRGRELEWEVSDRLYGVVRSLAWDGRTLVLPATDRTLHVWRDGARTVLEGHTAPLHGCAVEGEWVASGSEDRTVRVWGPRPLVLRGHAGTVRAVAFAGDWLVSAGSTVVRVWARDGTPHQTVEAHRETVLCLAVAGSLLATGSEDATVKVWRFEGGRLLPNPLVLRGHEGAVLGLRFAADGQTLASVSADRTVRLWNLRGPELPAVLRDPAGAVRAVAFGEDELACAGEDGRVRLLSRSAAKLVGQARARAGRDFTAEEVQRFGLSLWAEQLPEEAPGSAAAFHAASRERPERALPFVRRALRLEPENPRYLAALARAQGNLDEVPAGLRLEVVRRLALAPGEFALPLDGLEGAALALCQARSGGEIRVRDLDDSVLRGLVEDVLESSRPAGLEALALLCLDALFHRGDPGARAQFSRLFAPLFRRIQDGVCDEYESLLTLEYQDATIPSRLKRARDESA